MNNDPIYAYVIMRNDLISLGAGKAAAHAHHAASVQGYHIRNHGNILQKKILSQWENQANGAGTCVTLSADEETMKYMVYQIGELWHLGCSAGVWHDPSYPSTSPRGFCLMGVDVCGWAIGPKSLLKPFLNDLPLMNNSGW
jgi:peptidyl-tRNA hydrolase